MKTEIIVAADLPDAQQVKGLVDTLGDTIHYYKVGLELFIAEGPSIIAMLKDRGKLVFLDLKLHDIPRTVARAVTRAAHYGVSLLTVHAGGGRAMLTAAAEAAAQCGDRAPRVIAVTTLTSLDQHDLGELGVSRPLNEHTAGLGHLAIECGVGGLVCSPLEVADIRARVGAGPVLVTPGIRPADGDVGDQKRVATPRAAAEAGADFLVVGRPIVRADNPADAARRMLDELR